MSNTNGSNVAISGTALVWAIAAMFVAVLAAVVAIALGLPESQNPAGLIAQILMAFAALTGVIGTLFTVRGVKRQVEAVEGKVDQAAAASADAAANAAQTAANTATIVQQTNGNLDRRIRSLSYDAMRKALVDHLEGDDDKAPSIH